MLPVTLDKDVASGAWYNEAVSFIAAREITSGTGNAITVLTRSSLEVSLSS